MQTKEIDIDSACYQIINVSSRPDFLAARGKFAWVIDDNNGLFKKLSVSRALPLLEIAVPGACAAPVIAYNAVWIMSCQEKKLWKINLNTGKVIAKFAVGLSDPNGEMTLAAGGGSIWELSDSVGVLSRIDPTTGKVMAKVRVSPHSFCAAFGYDAVWVTNSSENSVQRIDVKTNLVVATIPVGISPRFISVGGRGVWTLNQGDGTVSRINPATNALTATIDVQAKGPGGDIAEGGGKVWIVSTNTERPVQTIDIAGEKVSGIYRQSLEDGNPKRVDGAVRVAGDYVWISGLFRKKVWVFKK